MSDNSQVTERVISQFLTELDGLEELKGVLVLAATNRKDLIDSAIIRTGRFDFTMEFPLPDAKARQSIFNIHMRGKPIASDINLEALAQQTEGLAGSDIEVICREAAMTAIREYIRADGKKSKLQISKKHFDIAASWLKAQKETA